MSHGCFEQMGQYLGAISNRCHNCNLQTYSFVEGVGGRLADALTQAGIPTNTFSIFGQQIVLAGTGEGPSQSVLSSFGLPEFNANPSINNMDSVIKTLNNDTTADSGFHAETWSYKLSESLAKHELLKQEIDVTVVNTEFPEKNRIGDELKMVTRVMQTWEARGSKRDIFYVQDSGHDSHRELNKVFIHPCLFAGGSFYRVF